MVTCCASGSAAQTAAKVRMKKGRRSRDRCFIDSSKVLLWRALQRAAANFSSTWSVAQRMLRTHASGGIVPPTIRDENTGPHFVPLIGQKNEVQCTLS